MKVRDNESIVYVKPIFWTTSVSIIWTSREMKTFRMCSLTPLNNRPVFFNLLAETSHMVQQVNTRKFYFTCLQYPVFIGQDRVGSIHKL